MKEYTVYFEQINAQVITVKASSPREAISKAEEEAKEECYPQLKCVEYTDKRIKERYVLEPEDIY